MRNVNELSGFPGTDNKVCLLFLMNPIKKKKKSESEATCLTQPAQFLRQLLKEIHILQLDKV